MGMRIHTIWSIWAWEIKRYSWEIARWGHLPMSKAKLRLGKITHVSWPAIDKPSIGYPSIIILFLCPCFSILMFFLSVLFFSMSDLMKQQRLCLQVYKVWVMISLVNCTIVLSVPLWTSISGMGYGFCIDGLNIWRMSRIDHCHKCSLFNL